MEKKNPASWVVKKQSLTILLFIIFINLFIVGCKNSSPEESRTGQNAFLKHALQDTSDFYFVDLKASGDITSDLPVGMFDSGTGGLTVLNALVQFDNYINSDKKPVKGGDGKKDFILEQFIYFGDQANMPYGNYAAVNRTGFLKELILKDVLFLLGNRYFRHPDDKRSQRDKKSVKMIVIACNTATAYGKNDVEEMLAKGGSKIKVVGVIDAGVKGALAMFEKDEDGTIAVMATAGTVSSDGYLNTFNSIKKDSGYSGNIQFIQQAGEGIAEAIDEEQNYIARNTNKPRKDYRGPSFSNPDLKINEELLSFYNFDTAANALLREYDGNKCIDIQLNSPENYLSFYIVSLCEQLKSIREAKPLKTLILGCTHYPFYSDFIRRKLTDLHNLKIDNKYPYRNILSDSVILIDPAENTAMEVYEYLAANNLLSTNGSIDKSEFYISVPDNLNSEIRTDSMGRFIYDYKYGRKENHFYDTKQVPVSRLNTNEVIISRLSKQIPEVFSMIRMFNSDNEKTKFLNTEDRL